MPHPDSEAVSGARAGPILLPEYREARDTGRPEPEPAVAVATSAEGDVPRSELVGGR